MSQSTRGLNQYQKGEGVFQKQEPLPHLKKFKRFVDGAIYVMGFIVPIFTIPQATEIWLNRTAAGVSSITWIVYLINTIIWTVYGILHKEKPVIFTFSLMTIINILVVAGIIAFG